MTELSTAERLDRLESRVEIAALIAGYCEGVDRRDGAKFDGLWHDDAVYLIGAGRGDFHGRPQHTVTGDPADRGEYVF